MRLLWNHTVQLWHEKFAFRLASSYLVALCVLVLLLPWLPLPFGPQDMDLANNFMKPFISAAGSKSHLLGTDVLGRDVLVNTLWGARTAFFISIPVMALTAALGTTLGTAAGFFGDKGYSFSYAQLIILVVEALVLIFYVIYLPLQIVTFEAGTYKLWISLATAGIMILFLQFVMLQILLLLPVLKHKYTVPLDSLVLRLIETLTSIPTLILILVLASFTPSSVLLLSCLLVLTSWTGIARLSRAEMLRIKQQPFFEAARSIGLRRKHLIFRHALPNMLGPVVVSFTFGVASLMAFESTLSFLGVGAQNNFSSWGSTISGIRSNLSAWWLVVFPGSFLALTVLCLQTCSYYLLNKIRNK